MTSAPGHPSPDHILRELGLEIDVRADGTVHGWMRMVDTLRAPSGAPRLGVVATAVDMVCGIASLRACTPDRVATADLSLHVLATGAPAEVEIVMHVRRRGRRTLVMEAELLDERGLPVGLGVLTFAVLPQPPGAPVLDQFPVGRQPVVARPVPASQPFVPSAGVVVRAPGDVSVDVVPRVRNSLGALNGGILTALVDEAVATAAAAALGGPAETTEVHVAFLELGRVGPVRARASVVGEPIVGAGGRATVDVTVLDEGNHGELLTRATGVAVAA